MPTISSITLHYNCTPVRVVSIDGQPWFVAADVFKCIGVLNTTTAVKSLHYDEVRLIEVLAQRPVQALSEKGLRKKLMRSMKPEAHALLDWAVNEVIPVHREAATAEKHVKPDLVQRLAARVAELEQRLAALSELAKSMPHATQAALRTL
jgi:prophage antirepressor-like protein